MVIGPYQASKITNTAISLNLKVKNLGKDADYSLQYI